MGVPHFTQFEAGGRPVPVAVNGRKNYLEDPMTATVIRLRRPIKTDLDAKLEVIEQPREVVISGEATEFIAVFVDKDGGCGTAYARGVGSAAMVGALELAKLDMMDECSCGEFE
jgi:hypothetical protein